MFLGGTERDKWQKKASKGKKTFALTEKARHHEYLNIRRIYIKYGNSRKPHFTQGYQAKKDMLKVNNRNTRKRCKIYSKLTIKKLELSH